MDCLSEKEMLVDAASRFDHLPSMDAQGSGADGDWDNWDDWSDDVSEEWTNIDMPWPN